jgi:argininosuccinate lyase
VGYLRLPDGLVQTSSIMPQKRNPVPLEHARALASKAFGQALAIPIAVHNTPFGDIVDTEDDLQPLVATMFKDANRAVRLVAMALGAAQFDVARMRERATCGWVTVTELADALARDHGLSFRMAHAVATAVVSRVGESSTATGTSIADAIAAASQTLSGREIRLSDAELARVLSPEHFVAVRRTWGGPAPEIVAAATDAASAALEGDRAKIVRIREQITASAVELKSAVAAI